MLTSELSPIVVPAVLWGLITLSVVTWALFVIKLLQFGRVRLMNTHFKKQFWAARDFTQGQRIVAEGKGPMARIARAGFAVVTGNDVAASVPVLRNQIDRGDRLERALQREIDRERRTLESWVSVLASFGSTAPFIGLFGTVWGIMGALISIGETGTTGLETVAGPVGHALIATGLGIAVAVPAVLIYNFLVRRLKAGVYSMKNFAHDFYNLCQQSGFEIEQGKLTEPRVSSTTNARQQADNADAWPSVARQQ